MPLKYITDTDADEAAALMSDLPPEKFATGVKQYLERVNYERAKASGSPLIVKAAGVGAKSLAANTVRGLSLLTTGKGDDVMKSLSDRITRSIDPSNQRIVAEASEGPLIGKGALDTLSSLVGQQIPLLASIGLGGGLAGLLGKGVGLAGSALKVAEVAGGLVPMSVAESGSLLETTDRLGIDKDIADRAAAMVGPISGAIEEAQSLLMLGPWKGVSKAGQKALQQTLKKSKLASGALKELGIVGLEGLEEGGQGYVSNKGTEYAIRMMKERYGEEWQPLEPYEPQDLGRSIAAGAFTAGIIRTAGKVASIPAKQAYQYAEARELVEADGINMFEDIKSKKKIEEILPMSRPTISGEALGERRSIERGKQGLTEGQVRGAINSTENMNELRGLAESVGIPVRDPKGKMLQIPKSDLKEMIISKMGLIKEGPRTEVIKVEVVPDTVQEVTPTDTKISTKVVEGGKQQLVVKPPPKPKRKKMVEVVSVVLDPVRIDTVTEQDKINGATVDNLIREVYKRLSDKEEARIKIRQARGSSLNAALGSSSMAFSKELNDFEKVQLSKGDQNLGDKLTRKQYLTYTDNLIGILRKEVSKNQGNKATLAIEGLGVWDAKLMENHHTPPVRDENGKWIEIGELPKELPQVSMLFHWLAPFTKIIDRIERLTKFKMLELDRVLMTRMHEMRESAAKLSIVHQILWKGLPKPLTQGSGRRALREMTFWLGVKDNDKRWKITKQLGMRENTLDAYAKRVIELSKSNLTIEQVKDAAAKLEGKYRVMYDWFAQSGAITWDKYRDNYFPIAWQYWNAVSKERDPISFSAWLEHNNNHQRLKDEFGITNEDLANISDLGDTVNSLRRKGVAIPGNATAFFEYMRNKDVAWLEAMAEIELNTDVEAMFDTYMRQYLQKIYFEDISPSVSAFITKVTTQLTNAGVPSDQFKSLMVNYLDSIMGMPETQDKALRRMNILTPTNAVGRILRKGAEAYNKKFGHMTMGEIPDKVSPNDVIKTMTTLMYPRYLGLPWGWKSPIKNIATQNPMAAVTGLKDYFTAIIKLGHDAEFRDKIRSEKYRVEFPAHDWDRFAGKGRVRRAAEYLMTLFTASDNINVMTAAAVGDIAWSRLDAEFAKSPTLKHLTLDQFTKIVFKGKSPKSLGVKDEDVMDPKRNIPWTHEFKYSGPRAFSGIARETFDMIRRGERKTANHMFKQYLVNLSQWRYGPGGTPAFLRNSMVRMLFMFATWPLEYLHYEAMLFNLKNGMLKVAFEIHMAQLLVASLLVGMGLSAHRWIWAGGMPERFGFLGPIADMINEILRILRGTSDVATATLTGAPAKDVERAQREFTMALDELLE